jgi:putative SOS response-associated peptidase YedK
VCGRYSLKTRRSDELQAKLAEILGVEAPPPERGFERFNIAPTQAVLAVVDDREARRIAQLRWGVVPHWAKPLKTRFSMINARAETLDQKPAYRPLVAQSSHRCLILADGWYEWQRPEDPRQPKRPLYFSLADGELFCFAGLWTRSTSPRRPGSPELHDHHLPGERASQPDQRPHARRLRRPRVLPCLASPLFDSAAARALLAPLPPEQMNLRPASPLVKPVRHEGPDCLTLPAAA